MPDSKPTKKPPFRRRQFIVNRPLQYSIMFTALGALVTVAILFIGAHVVLPTEDVFEAFTGEQTRRVILTLNAAFFALTFITLGIIMLFLSHRVAGPALVFERALRAFMKGNFKERTTIRKKDYLQGLSQTLRELGVHMREQHEQNDAFLSELDQALTAKDATRAARLLQRFQETRVVDQAEQDPDPEAAAPQAEVPAEEPRAPVASGS